MSTPKYPVLLVLDGNSGDPRTPSTLKLLNQVRPSSFAPGVVNNAGFEIVTPITSLFIVRTIERGSFS